MTHRGYSSPSLVAEELGVTFTAGQTTQAEGLIEEAEAFVDRFTGRAWITTSPATETLVVPADGLVYLTRRPVTAITSVSVRPATIGGASTALAASSSYELLDAATGLLAVSSGYHGYRVSVTYTHTNDIAALPADIRRAATLLVAHWLTPRLHPERAGLAALSLGSGEIAQTFRRREIPAEVLAILRARDALVFA